jgi:hypothetical protein
MLPMPTLHFCGRIGSVKGFKRLLSVSLNARVRADGHHEDTCTQSRVSVVIWYADPDVESMGVRCLLVALRYGRIFFSPTWTHPPIAFFLFANPVLCLANNTRLGNGTLTIRTRGSEGYLYQRPFGFERFSIDWYI